VDRDELVKFTRSTMPGNVLGQCERDAENGVTLSRRNVGGVVYDFIRHSESSGPC